jgi:hypothetical protein
MFEPKLTIKELRKSLNKIPEDYDDYVVRVVDDGLGLMQTYLIDKDCIISTKVKQLYIFSSIW